MRVSISMSDPLTASMYRSDTTEPELDQSVFAFSKTTIAIQ